MNKKTLEWREMMTLNEGCGILIDWFALKYTIWKQNNFLVVKGRGFILI
jgi:hypothetical protein